MAKRSISKWQKASDDINHLRFALEDFLDSFTEEEKESIRFVQLVESVDTNFDNAINHATGKKPRRKFSWFSWQTLTVVLSSPALLELGKVLWNLVIGG